MFRTDITERFEQLKAAKNCEVTQAIIEQLIKQDFHGQLSYEVVDELCEKFKRSRVELALYCIAIAACYAVTPVSDFNVGAVAIGKNGDFYFGANQRVFRGMYATIRSRRAKCNLARIFSRGNFDNRCGCELYPLWALPPIYE